MSINEDKKVKKQSEREKQQSLEVNAQDAGSHMKGVIARFQALCAAFLASSEGKSYLTDRGSFLVEVEKLRSEVFANLVRQKMADGSLVQSTRIVIDDGKGLKPVLFAKVVTTAKPLLPRLYKRQRWSLFKKHERVLLLFVHNSISCIDESITLSDLNSVYEACGMEPFSKRVPWIGVGSAEVPNIKSDAGERHYTVEEFDPTLGYKVGSVRFDEALPAFIVQAKDWSKVLFLG